MKTMFITVLLVLIQTATAHAIEKCDLIHRAEQGKAFVYVEVQGQAMAKYDRADRLYYYLTEVDERQCAVQWDKVPASIDYLDPTRKLSAQEIYEMFKSAHSDRQPGSVHHGKSGK